MKINIFIPGRLESTRLPNKLILPIGNTCLFNNACNLLNSLPEKYGKYVLIESEKLIEIASKYKNINILKRPKNTCNVDGPLNHIFGKILETDGDYFMFLNPCFMFLKPKTIIDALEQFEFNLNFYKVLGDSGEYCMTSVKPFKSWLYKHNTLITEVNKNWSTKDINSYYQPAHIFHIFSRKMLSEDNTMLSKKHDIYVIDNELECLDVDTEFDFKIVKALW